MILREKAQKALLGITIEEGFALFPGKPLLLDAINILAGVAFHDFLIGTVVSFAEIFPIFRMATVNDVRLLFDFGSVNVSIPDIQLGVFC